MGIIGLGYWGPNAVRNLYANRRCFIKWCCDLRQERLDHIKEIYPAVQVTRDANVLFEDKDLDAIVISTPVSSHYTLVKQSLTKLKHVLVEKPISTESKLIEELIALAEDKKKVLMVDHTFLYSSPVKKMKELINQNYLGEIHTIDIQRLNLGIFQKDINVIWDLAPHDISILLHILEKKPISVMTFGDAHIQKLVEDSCYVYLNYSGGVTAHLHLSWLSPRKIRQFTVIGSEKMLFYDDVEPAEKIKIYDKGVSLKKEHGSPTHKYCDTFDEHVSYRLGDIFIPVLDLYEPLGSVCREFIGCIEELRKPLSDGSFGKEVVEIIEAAQTSLKAGGKKIYL